jgi:toxin ParE1/3/4
VASKTGSASRKASAKSGMTKRIVITPKASTDIHRHFEYLAQHNLEAALNFFDAARQTFAQIAWNPGIGSPYIAKNQTLLGLWKWSVKGFKTQLIFYFDRDDWIEIIRVLNAARDIKEILDKRS